MLEMEDTELYENLGFWEQDLGLPEVTWTGGLFSSSREDVRQESVLEGDSFWKDADFPLKEANKNKLNDPPIDETFDFSQDLINEDWLDERIDIGAALESFIYSPGFEEVFNDLNESEEYMKTISVAEESSTVSEEEINNLSANLSVESESSGVDQVEIETNEVSMDGTTIYYLNPCEMSSPSMLDSDEIHYVVSPSISKSSDEFLVLENVDAHHINGKVQISENGDSQFIDEKLISEIAESSSSIAVSEPSSSFKSKIRRRKMRVEPYKDNSDDSSSCSSGNSNGSSAPGSPQLSDISEEAVGVPTSKRKERKKYQNRNAAVKYRQKKRKLTEAITNEEQDLENKNKELKGKCEQLSNEVGYLKKLMREILIAKGLLKE